MYMCVHILTAHIICHIMLGRSSTADPLMATSTISNPCSCIWRPCLISRIPDTTWFRIAFIVGSSSICTSSWASSSFSPPPSVLSLSLRTTHPASRPASCQDRVGCGSLCTRRKTHLVVILTFATHYQCTQYIIYRFIFDIYDTLPLSFKNWYMYCTVLHVHGHWKYLTFTYPKNRSLEHHVDHGVQHHTPHCFRHWQPPPQISISAPLSPLPILLALWLR